MRVLDWFLISLAGGSVFLCFACCAVIVLKMPMTENCRRLRNVSVQKWPDTIDGDCET